ncbi:MAG: cytochrome c family protein [Parvibaculaceae bacterium]
MSRLGVMMTGLALLIVGAAAPAAAGEGAALFVKNCGTCHIIAKNGDVRAGPPLRGVIGRKAGTVEGFNYSAGLKASGIVWSERTLDQWLAFPKKMVRDTIMLYRQNDPEIRKAIIAYIATQKD